MKFEWISKYWTPEEAANAEEWMIESVSTGFLVIC
jgi:hypothetical protein